MNAPRHFLDLDLLDAATLRDILDRGLRYKAALKAKDRSDRPMAGQTLAMVFEKPSTRTRVSFELAAKQLGGEAVVLSSLDSQLGRGEPIGDTARVLSRYADAIMIRTTEKAKLDEMASFATVPVINGLTDFSHPCQIMADLMTLAEHKGDLAKLSVAWTGDGNNVLNSWIHAAARFGFELRIACPEPLSPPALVVEKARAEGANLVVTSNPQEAVSGVDCVTTDTWFSMGVEATVNRHNMLMPYQVNDRLMACARPDAVFLHCLPAKRGQEVTHEVIEGPQSLVWDEAENRLHAQKGILAWCLDSH